MPPQTAIPTEGRVFVAQLIREIRKRENIGADALSPGTKTWHDALEAFRQSLTNADGPVKAAKLLQAARERLRIGQRQGACFVNFFHTRSRSGSFEILTWEVAKHPLLNKGYDGIFVRAWFCLLHRDGGGVAGHRARLAFISWHALARMQERSSVDIFTAGGVVAACGVVGYIMQESPKHAHSELNYAIENMVCTGRLRFATDEDSQFRFFDVSTVLPLDEVPTSKRKQGIAITQMVHAYVTGSDADPRGCADKIAVLPCRDDDYVSRTLRALGGTMAEAKL
jgi:hypothetical protein